MPGQQVGGNGSRLAARHRPGFTRPLLPANRALAPGLRAHSVYLLACRAQLKIYMAPQAPASQPQAHANRHTWMRQAGKKTT